MACSWVPTAQNKCTRHYSAGAITLRTAVITYTFISTYIESQPWLCLTICTCCSRFLNASVSIRCEHTEPSCHGNHTQYAERWVLDVIQSADTKVRKQSSYTSHVCVHPHLHWTEHSKSVYTGPVLQHRKNAVLISAYTRPLSKQNTQSHPFQVICALAYNPRAFHC